MGELFDHRRKLDWAKRHYRGFQASVRRFTKQNPYELHGIADKATGLWVARLSRVREVPPDWSMRVADAVHCLRSSLDVLVYQLAVRNRGKRGLTKQELLLLKFVVGKSPADFEKQAERHLAPLSAEMRTAIGAIQTYSHPRGNLINGLRVLQNFSNVDKHRVITPVLAVAQSGHVQAQLPGEPAPRILGSFTGDLVEGRVLASIPNAKVSDLLHRGAVFSASGKIEVRFGKSEPGFGGSPHELLSKAIHYCEKEAFPALEPFLSSER